MKTIQQSKSKLPLATAALALLAMTVAPAMADNTGSGGTITYTDASGLNPRSSPGYPGGFVVHSFTSSGTLNIPLAASANVLVVAGGGGGGYFAGGGGAGGLIYNSAFSLTGSNSYPVTVGAGGAGDTTTDNTGGNGGNSAFDTLTAIGGGGGASRGGTATTGFNGAAGGSGGGASPSDSTSVLTTGGAATALQGNAGGIGRSPAAASNWGGGGGGGAGAAGGAATGNSTTASGGAGGVGLAYALVGSSVYYAGGGGGGSWSGATSGAAGAGGLGGGGAGSKSGVGANAVANTGGGGGGSCLNFAGGTGGSGVVIVRYAWVSAPTVSTLNPPDNATGVAQSPSLVVTFNQAVLKGTGYIEIKQTGTDSVVESIDVSSSLVTLSAASATITPSVTLESATEYYVLIAAGAFTETGAALLPFGGITDTTSWSFKTVGTPPIVSTLSPADNATLVADTANPVVTFDQPVIRGTGNIEIRKTSDGSVLDTLDVTSSQVTLSGASATLHPIANLPLGTECYVAIPAGAFKATAGSTPEFAGITDPTAWSFTTLATPNTLTLNPADNATGVPPYANLVLTFDEPIQKGTGNIVIKKTSDNSLVETIDVTSGLVTISGTTATINPAGSLPLGAECYVQIPAGAFTATLGSLPAFPGITDTTSWSFTAVATLNLTWDANGTTASQTDGTGTWLGANQWWNGSGNSDWYNDPASPGNATIGNGGAGGTLTLGAVNAGSVSFAGFTGTYTLSGGSLTQSGGITVGATAGALAISTPIAGTGGITKSNTGILTLSGTNTFSGGITINAGALNGVTSASLGTGPLTFAGNALILPNYQNGYPLASYPNTVNLVVNPGVTADLNILNQYYNMVFNGVVSGSGTIWVDSSTGGGNGAGYLTLANSGNTFAGTLQVGTNVTTNLAGATVNVNSLADGAGQIVMYGSTSSNRFAFFQLNSGTATPLLFNSRQFAIAGTAAGATAQINNNNATITNTITINTDLAVTATVAKTLTLGGTNTGTNTFAGKIADGTGSVITLVKAGTGSWILSGANTYTGKTTVSAGMLSINSIQDLSSATASALGKPTTLANGTIDLATTGTLQYTGSGNSSNRVLNLATAAGGTMTLDASGTSGTLALTGGVTSTGTSATSTLVLTGTGSGSESGVIANGTSTNVVAVTKSGTGTWSLAGLNTYSGTTTVNSGGTLALASTGGLTFILTNTTSNKLTGAGSATLNGSFTINTAAVSATSGTWTLVDIASKSFGANFTVPGFTSDGNNVWRMGAGTKLWAFDAVSGKLTLSGFADFMSFGIPGSVGVIDVVAKTVALTVPWSPWNASLATLNPTFSVSSGVCNQTSGSPPSPAFAANGTATYVIQDSAKSITNTYTVTVTLTPPATAKVISNVYFPGLGYAYPTDNSGTSFALQVVSGTPVAALSPTYSMSTYASGNPVSGAALNFTTPQSYTITAEDGSQQVYTVAVLPYTGYEARVKASNPFAYWPMNEGVGFVAYDNTSSHNGSYSNPGVTFGVTGPVGQNVVTLSGATGVAMQVPQAAALCPDGSFSVEMWVKPAANPPSTSPQYVAANVNLATNREGWYLAQDNGATFGVGNAFAIRMFNRNGSTQACQLSAPIDTVRWYHLVLTYDGGTKIARLYEDGVTNTTDQVGTATLASYYGNTSANPFTIGKRSDGSLPWAGSAGDVAFYTRALTAAEVQYHFTGIASTLSYASWALGPFPSGKTLTDTNPALDFDHGGLPTGVEWVVGGDPTNPSDDAGKAPTLDNTSDPGNFLFVFRRTKDARDDASTSISVEYGSDLSGWHNSIDNGAADGVVTSVITNGFATDIDKVTVAIPRTHAVGGKLFARLKVALATP